VYCYHDARQAPENRIMRVTVLASVVALACSAGCAYAQTPPSEAAPAPAAAPASSVEPMEDPQTGDHWTYELRDEITGDIKSTFLQTVLEATANEISVRATIMGNPNNGFLTFDRSWNLINNGIWRYSPNDGTGIRTPLAAGKSWPLKSNDVNTTAGATWKRSGTAKVLGQESITTKAGTFDTFRIQASFQLQNNNDPTKKLQITQNTWYAPAIDHWVKRTSESRQDGQLREKSTVELIEYGRR
jgi:hypothetical protein